MKKNAESDTPKQGVAKKFQDFRVFLEKAQLELKKVIWPNKQETITTSSAVLMMVVVLAFFLGITDLVLTKIIAAILS